MNLHFYRLLLCVPVFAGALSCSQREALPETDSMKEVVIFGTQEDFAGNRTRTVVGEVLDNGALAMNWSVEDKIGVFGNGTTTNEPFTSTNTYPIRETGFKGNLADGDTPEYAYYPYSAAATDKNAIPVNIPKTQEYSGTSSIAEYDFKASNKITELSDGSFKCNMRQLGVLLRFEINLDDIKSCIKSGIDETLTLPEDEKVLYISMSSAVAMTGDYTYDLTASPMVLKAGTTTSGDVTMNLTETPLLSGTVIAYAVVAPGAQSGQELTIDIKTTHCSIQLTTKALCDFESGKYYVVPLNASVFNNTENQVGVSEELIPDTPDPGPETGEPANCYMITTTGTHSFTATTIGNGADGIIAGAGFHTSSAIIAPKSAKLLWQDTDNFIGDVTYADGKVSYTANGNVGNAMIAVYSGENCTGDILWSWHIWGVGDELPTDDVITNQAGATFTVMDRTLGAWSKTSYYTTLYQWGRKDPFPNSSTYYVDGVATDISKSYNVYAPTSTSDATILSGVKHPDCLLNGYKASGEWDWIAVNNDLLWGDSNTNNQFTWYSDGQLSNKEAGAGWTNNKTIYDPCPAGYRVSNKFTFTGFVVYTSGTATLKGDMNKGQIEEKFNCITTSFLSGTVERYKPKFENGYYFKANTTDTEGAYYPMAGFRYGSDGEPANVGISTSYHYSSPTENSHQNQTFDIGAYVWLDDATGQSGKAAGNNASLNVMDSKYKWVANPVRCVREK